MKRRASAAHGNAGEEGSIFRALSSCRWGAQHWPPGGFLTRAPWWCNREAAWTCQRNKSRIRVFVVYQLIDRSLRPCTQTLDWDFQKRRVICVSTSTWHIYGCCWRDWQPEKEKHSGFWGDLGKIQLLCEITTGFSAMPSSPSESPRFHIRSFAFTFGRKKKVRECNLPVHFTQTSIASLYRSVLLPKYPTMASPAAMDFVFSLTSFRIAFWFIPNKRESRSARPVSCSGTESLTPWGSRASGPALWWHSLSHHIFPSKNWSHSRLKALWGFCPH